MRPAVSLGLFGKGRASSPVQRKGCEFSFIFPSSLSLTALKIVPDLTFSEMTFLKSRRDQPEATNQRAADKTRRRNRDKMADTEAEISRYFTSRVPRSRRVLETGNRADQAGHDHPIEQRSCGARNPPLSLLPPVELPDRPFLGFGSSGVSIASPIKLDKCLDPHREDSRTLPTLPGNPSTAGSAGYYTWSPSEQSSTLPQTQLERSCNRHLALQDVKGSPNPPLQNQLMRTSIASTGSNVPDNQANDLVNSFDGKEHHERPVNIAHLGASSSRGRSKRNMPESRPVDTKDVVRTAPLPDADAMMSDREASDQSSTKHTSEEANARDRPHIDLDQSLRNGFSTSVMPCKTIHSFDVALENLLHTCQNGFGSSEKPRGTLGDRVQESLFVSPKITTSNRKATEHQTTASATLVTPTGQGKEISRPEKLHRSPRASEWKSGPSATAPTPSDCAFLQEHQYRQVQEPGHTPVTLETLPRAFHESVNPPFNFMTGMCLRQPSGSRSHSSGAWNAYHNMYEKQLVDLPNDSYLNNDELRGFESWTDEPIPERQFPVHESPYLGSGNLREGESFPSEFFEENSSQQNVCELDFATTVEPPLPFEDEHSQYHKSEPGSEKHWDIRLDTYHTPGFMHDILTPVPLFANPERAATTHKTFSRVTKQALFTSNATSVQSRNYQGSRDGDVKEQSSHLSAGGGDGPLSNFWRPNKLY